MLLLSKLISALIETFVYGMMYQLSIYRKRDSRPRLGVFFAFIYVLTILLDFSHLSHNLIFSALLIVIFNGMLKYDIKTSSFFALQGFLTLMSSKLMTAMIVLFVNGSYVDVLNIFETEPIIQQLMSAVIAILISLLNLVTYNKLKKRVGLNRKMTAATRIYIGTFFSVFILGSVWLLGYLAPSWSDIVKIKGLEMVMIFGYIIFAMFLGLVGYQSFYALCFRHQFAKISQMAENDPLTGLMSRSAGMNFMRKAFNQSKASGQRLTIAFVDVNDLKVVNDKFGHNAGDHLLEKIADVIKSNIRDTDGALRFGGDEFIIVLQDCPQYRAEEILTQINIYLNRYNLSGELGFKIGISYGLVEYNKMRHNNVLDLVSDADTEMYKNKKKLKQPNMSPNR